MRAEEEQQRLYQQTRAFVNCNGVLLLSLSRTENDNGHRTCWDEREGGSQTDGFAMSCHIPKGVMLINFQERLVRDPNPTRHFLIVSHLPSSGGRLRFYTLPMRVDPEFFSGSILWHTGIICLLSIIFFTVERTIQPTSVNQWILAPTLTQKRMVGKRKHNVNPVYYRQLY